MTDTPSSADVIEGMREALKQAELVLDALRIYFKNRDQNSAEMKLYGAIKIALAGIRGPEIVDPLPDSKPDSQGGA